MTDNNIREFDDEIPEKKLKILEAAIKVFSEKGFEGSRTSEIAKEANVAEGTIFKYFKTKKDILLSLLLPLTLKFIKPFAMKSAEKILNKGKDEPVDEVLKNLLLDILHLVKKNMPLVKTVVIESLYHEELLVPIKEKLAPQVLELLDGYVNYHKEKGDFKDYDTRFITRTIMSMLLGYVVLSSAFPEFFSLDEEEKEIENIVNVLINGIKNGGV
ncbi:TetR/AcrR family transcriptional regulator [Caloramator australicus]|uniref:Transcriptional regulator, TetR family n=1 Tax=Caloramator australicus RC3 TaxID=857293 RepID=I7LK07_9CLOT|nr:TetR/AcrR family transcriptional regulator [Caloramator australicus]CCJ34118.1 Transcriptional regulator, TetR family [Caloramator australicus RC3]